MGFGYGWLPDVPDFRDYKYRATFGGEVPFWRKAAPCLARRRFPDVVDLTEGQLGPFWPEVYNQGALGSCVAQSVVAAAFFTSGLLGEPLENRNLSRLMLYGEARGWVPEDTGAYIREAFKAIARVGVCQEENWPYNPARYRERPGPELYEEGAPWTDVTYARLSGLDDMLDCLSSAQPRPFVLGISCYDSFGAVSRANPVVPMPRRGESLRGGHAILAVGYDQRNKWLKIRNSWGTGWGIGGYAYLPFEYASNGGLADDFWTFGFVKG